MQFEVTAEQAIEWARDYRREVEAAGGDDTEENRKKIFAAYLLFSFAESMQEAIEETAATVDTKALN